MRRRHKQQVQAFQCARAGGGRRAPPNRVCVEERARTSTAATTSARTTNKGQGSGLVKGGTGSDNRGKGLARERAGHVAPSAAHPTRVNEPDPTPSHQRVKNVEDSDIEEFDVGGIWDCRKSEASGRRKFRQDWRGDAQEARKPQERYRRVEGAQGGCCGCGERRLKRRPESDMRFHLARVQKSLASATEVVDAGNKTFVVPRVPGRRRWHFYARLGCWRTH